MADVQGGGYANYIAPAASGLFGIITGAMQNQWNRKMVREQNEYNSPAQQMARYRAAGLNPNLIYGQGNSGNQSAPVSQVVPDVAEAVGKGLSLSTQKKQLSMLQDQGTRQADANIALTYSKTHNEDMKALINMYRGIFESAREPYFGEMAKTQFESAKAQLANWLKDLGVKQAQLLNLQMDKQIKQQVLTERSYYNQLHQYGMERNDPWYFRQGLNYWNKGKAWINQHLFRSP